ncbi:MAG TPA: hypothetical protein VNO30_11585 [Kofleriaceae bacterium]|nr:hypothetical protein [Kofleriaceae bacterium]
MRTLMRAGFLLALAMLVSCTGDSSSTSAAASSPKTSAVSSTKPAAVSSTQPAAAQLTVTTDPAGLVQTPTANGVMVQLDDHFQNAVVARRNADGTVSVECHDEHQQAAAFMQGATATATARGVK